MKKTYSIMALYSIFISFCINSSEACFTNYWGIPFKNHNEILEYVKNILPSSPVILEAGANLGEHTLKMKAVWPNATMHVFEPLSYSFKTLRQNLKYAKGTYCYPFALSNHSGLVDFYINPGNTGACSINPPVHWNASEFQKDPIHIFCMAPDDWADLYDISQIDFMWLDMEGHELYALSRAENILKSVKVIFTRISFIPVRIGSTSHDALTYFLEKNGFSEIWRWEVGNGYGDALFVKKEFLS